MAIESLYPDGEVGTTTNFTGTWQDVDNPQATPGSDWMDPSDDALDNEVTFSTSTPTADLTTGAGLQTIKVHVRKQLTGGNDPNFDLHIREAGSATDLATLVTAQTVTSETGEDFSFTWDASVLSAVSGVDVEIHFFGNRSGGGPTARRNLSIGAVEWVADYTAAASTTPKSVSMTAVGTASLIIAVTYSKALSPTAVGTTSVIKSVAKTLGISASGNSAVTKQVSKFFAITAIGTGAVTKAATYTRLLNYSATGSNSLAAALMFNVAVNAVALGAVSLLTVGVLGIVSNIAVLGTAAVTKGIGKVLSYSGLGSNNILKATSKTLSSNATGSISTQKSLELNQSSSASATGTSGVTTNFIVAGAARVMKAIKQLAISLGLGI